MNPPGRCCEERLMLYVTRRKLSARFVSFLLTSNKRYMAGHTPADGLAEMAKLHGNKKKEF